MDVLNSAIVDPQHVFTAAQTAMIAREITYKAHSTKCPIQVVISKGALDVKQVAKILVDTEDSNPPARIAVDAITHEIAYHQESPYPCSRNEKHKEEDYANGIAIAQDADFYKNVDEKLSKLRSTNLLKEVIESVHVVNQYAEKESKDYVEKQLDKQAMTHQDIVTIKNNDNDKWLNLIAFVFFPLMILTIVGAGILNYISFLKWSSTLEVDEKIWENYRSICRNINAQNYENNATAIVKSIFLIREELKRTKKLAEWKTIWKETQNRLKEIEERSDLYNSHKENADKDDLLAAQVKIQADLLNLKEDISQLKTSIMPRMTKEVRDKILAGHQQTPGIDILMNQRIRSIEENIKTAEDILPSTMVSESFTISEMRKRYLPDTVNAYLEAKVKHPKEAQKLFNEQIDLLEQGVDTTLEAIAESNIDKLRTNGFFLRERFIDILSGLKAEDSPTYTT